MNLKSELPKLRWMLCLILVASFTNSAANNDVRNVQLELAAMGCAPGSADGQWGRKTTQAYELLASDLRGRGEKVNTLSCYADCASSVLVQIRLMKDVLGASCSSTGAYLSSAPDPDLGTSNNNAFRCQCDHRNWIEQCDASIELGSKLFEMRSNTNQCSRVDWRLDGNPHMTIVTDGVEIGSWFSQSSNPQAVIESCYVCTDSDYPVAGHNIATSTSDASSGDSHSIRASQLTDNAILSLSLVQGYHRAGLWANDDGEYIEKTFKMNSDELCEEYINYCSYIDSYTEEHARSLGTQDTECYIKRQTRSCSFTDEYFRWKFNVDEGFIEFYNNVRNGHYD